MKEVNNCLECGAEFAALVELDIFCEGCLQSRQILSDLDMQESLKQYSDMADSELLK